MYLFSLYIVTINFYFIISLLFLIWFYSYLPEHFFYLPYLPNLSTLYFAVYQIPLKRGKLRSEF